MYCANCGEIMDINNMICPQCRVPFGCGEDFCESCGAKLSEDMQKCAHCGADAPISLKKSGQAGEKSKSTAVILAFLLGFLGAHNFYLGFKGFAITQIVFTCTVILFPISVIWGIMDGVFLLFGKRDKDPLGYTLRK